MLRGLVPSGTLEVTGIEDRRPVAPGYALLGSFPNPSAQTVIRYRLGEPSRVVFEVFDITGRLAEQRALGVVNEGRTRWASTARGSATGSTSIVSWSRILRPGPSGRRSRGDTSS